MAFPLASGSKKGKKESNEEKEKKEIKKQLWNKKQTCAQGAGRVQGEKIVCWYDQSYDMISGDGYCRRKQDGRYFV